MFTKTIFISTHCFFDLEGDNSLRFGASSDVPSRGCETTAGVEKNTQNSVQHVLSQSREIGFGVDVKRVNEITHTMVQDYTNSFLFIEFPEDETHTSIIHTSTLTDGREIYTIRFGITSFKTQRPSYDGLAVVCRYPDGSLVLERPISKNIQEPDSRPSKEKESATGDPLLARYKKQLSDIGQSISKGIQQNTLTTEAIQDLLVSGERKLKIYDISPDASPECHFFLVYTNENHKKIECQISVYKRVNNQSGITEDIAEVHSLVRDADENLVPQLYLQIFDSLGSIQGKAQEKGLLLDINHSLIRLTRDERHDSENGSEREIEIPFAKRHVFLRPFRKSISDTTSHQ